MRSARFMARWKLRTEVKCGEKRGGLGRRCEWRTTKMQNEARGYYRKRRRKTTYRGDYKRFSPTIAVHLLHASAVRRLTRRVPPPPTPNPVVGPVGPPARSTTACQNILEHTARVPLVLLRLHVPTAISHVCSDFKTMWSALNFPLGLYELREMPETERSEYWLHALESAFPAKLAPQRDTDDSLTRRRLILLEYLELEYFVRLKHTPNTLHEWLLSTLRLGDHGFREQQIILRIPEAIGLQPERTKGDAYEAGEVIGD
jgi:hypothetical protein